MKLRTGILAIAAAGLITATPTWAQRGHGNYGNHGSWGSHGNYSGHRYGHAWGPFGFLLGTAILYSALQPRTVYYEPQVVYAPPPYVPATPVYVEQSYVPPPAVSAPPPRVAQSDQWWYFCNKPAGYYPYVRACPSGWERVPQTPPGPVRP